MTQTPVEKIKNEFNRHIATQSPGPFQATSQSSADLEKYTRELESHRALGRLNKDEIEQLKKADELQETIAKFNEQRARQVGGGPLYRPGGEEPKEDAAPAPLIIPNISAAQAEEIIEHFNKQFEEKILSKIDHNKFAAQTAPAPQEARLGEEKSGTNLQDYLSSIKADLPSIPFQDMDSGIDLSKLANKNKLP